MRRCGPAPGRTRDHLRRAAPQADSDVAKQPTGHVVRTGRDGESVKNCGRARGDDRACWRARAPLGAANRAPGWGCGFARGLRAAVDRPVCRWWVAGETLHSFRSRLLRSRGDPTVLRLRRGVSAPPWYQSSCSPSASARLAQWRLVGSALNVIAHSPRCVIGAMTSGCDQPGRAERELATGGLPAASALAQPGRWSHSPGCVAPRGAGRPLTRIVRRVSTRP